MNIRKIILSQLKKELSFGNKIKLYILKKYTFKIYEIGFKNGFSFKRKK